MTNTAFQSNAHTSSTRRPRILCIDDDPDVQATIALRMREYNVEIEHAYYGTQGIYEAVHAHPDLIVMDVAMPHGDGEYLLNCIKANSATAGIPVLVLSGMRDPSRKHRLLSLGAEEYLQKPIRFDDLLRQMSRFVEIRQCDCEEES